MNAPDEPSQKTSVAEARKRRLAAALRENLKRRKAQSRGRTRGEGEAEGPQPSPETTGS